MVDSGDTSTLGDKAGPISPARLEYCSRLMVIRGFIARNGVRDSRRLNHSPSGRPTDGKMKTLGAISLERRHKRQCVLSCLNRRGGSHGASQTIDRTRNPTHKPLI